MKCSRVSHCSSADGSVTKSEKVCKNDIRARKFTSAVFRYTSAVRAVHNPIF